MITVSCALLVTGRQTGSELMMVVLNTGQAGCEAFMVMGKAVIGLLVVTVKEEQLKV